MDTGTHMTMSRGMDKDLSRIVNVHHILVIDDDPDTIQVLKRLYQGEGYEFTGVQDGMEAFSVLTEVNPSLIVLDLLFPAMDGWVILARLRELTNTPILVISALSDAESIVRALKMGVDDYVTKPYNDGEVLARTEALLRRTMVKELPSRLPLHDLQMEIDLETRELIYRGNHIQLTGKLFEVMRLLVNGYPRVVTYETITSQIWGADNVMVRNRLKYLIYLLRNRLKKVDPERQVIQNVDRLGYKLGSK